MVWRYNLGFTPANITTSAKYNDGNWHQVIAARQGREGTLTVRTHNKKSEKVTGTSGGLFNQLDLVPQATRIFAGGVPDSFSLPPSVKNKRFTGGLDDYTYSENLLRLGLWNFVDGQANNEGKISRTLMEAQCILLSSIKHHVPLLCKRI